MTGIPAIALRNERTFLDELQERLAALTPEKYRTPTRTPGPGETIVGAATDYLKRLYTLVHNDTEEMKPLATEYQGLYGEMSGYMHRGVFWRLIDAVIGEPEIFRNKAERMRVLEEQVGAMSDGQKIVDSIFWHEARRTFPELKVAGRYNWVDANWNLSWSATYPGMHPQMQEQGGMAIVLR